jgi:thioredoxin 1
MATRWKLTIIVALLVSVAAIVSYKQTRSGQASPGTDRSDELAAAAARPAPDPEPANQGPHSTGETTVQSSVSSQHPPAVTAETEAEKPKRLPRLVDLGADKCIPCRMMAPILDELRADYRGRVEIEFIDVWKNPAAAQEYGVSVIPTQILLDADGTELYRHVGFLGKQDILAVFEEHGIALEHG